MILKKIRDMAADRTGKLSTAKKLLSICGVSIVIISAAVFSVESYFSGVTSGNLIASMFEERLSAGLNAASYYIETYYGDIVYKNGTLVDAKGNLISKEYYLIDKISKDLEVVATIFMKKDDDFIRVVTSITDDSGERAVGTFLGKNSAAYNPVINKEIYIGEAVILGRPFQTAYKPLIDQSGVVYGILFIGSEKTFALDIAGEYYLISFSIISILSILFIFLMFILIKNSIIKPILDISKSLSSSASQIGTASSQLSESSQEIANGASEQASCIEETTASMEELSSMVKQNVSNAREASILADKAAEESENGYIEMERMLSSMQEINKSSEAIRKVITVIEDIAFQTNMLALNASVEAARAGEVGMGFAVVADEVKELANRSAASAKETADMVNESQKKTEDGLEISRKLADSFKGILNYIKKVSEMTKEVEAASAQQDQGIEQVNKAIIELDSVVQANAAGAEETASSAEELQSQVQSLNEIVEKLISIINGKKEKSDKTIDIELYNALLKRLYELENKSAADNSSDKAVKKDSKSVQSSKNLISFEEDEEFNNM